MKCRQRLSALAIVLSFAASPLYASSVPVRGRNGMVASQKMLASEAGLGVLRDGGNAVATGLALAVTLPRAVAFTTSGCPIASASRRTRSRRTRLRCYARKGTCSRSLPISGALR